MKGIVLAGGSGSRLYPLTVAFSKQLLPIFDKPMIFYPLSVLMLAGIRDILIIVNPKDKNLFFNLLGDGSAYGIKLQYEIQKKPNGIAECFIIGKKFIKKDNVCLILGDNIFYGYQFSSLLKEGFSLKKGALIFTNFVKNPKDFAIAEFDKFGKVVSLQEKPNIPKTNHAVTGLYFYDNDVIRIAESLKPSKRGELEITDINISYLKNNLLKAYDLGRGFAWLDTGTQQSLLEAGEFVSTIEKRQGLKIACLEEIAFNFGWIDKKKLFMQYKKNNNSPYGDYLKDILNKL
jgi:glucose-1-phosphate thymidylyltransferase